MKRDPLKQYVALRESLSKRKAVLEAELSKINAALGATTTKVTTVAVAAPARAAAAPAGRRVKLKRAQNTMSLKAAVLAATKAKPLAKAEILEAVAKLGYKFAAKDPMNSLNTLLYTDKQIKNFGGKFGHA